MNGATPVLMDPVEREEWKRRRLGLRRFGGERSAIALPPLAPESLAERWQQRRTRRRFARRPVSRQELERLLACLAEDRVGGEAARLYPSAGGLYPIEVFLHLRPGRVADLEPGAYAYDPAEHRLEARTVGADLDRGIHVPLINQPVFDEAAFSLFLVADFAAIAPLYGGESWDFALLECGYLSQLLLLQAAPSGLGLCPIGGLDFAAVRHLFHLGDRHVLLHSHLGGCLPASPDEAEAAGDSEREEGEI